MESALFIRMNIYNGTLEYQNMYDSTIMEVVRPSPRVRVALRRNRGKYKILFNGK